MGVVTEVGGIYSLWSLFSRGVLVLSPVFFYKTRTAFKAFTASPAESAVTVHAGGFCGFRVLLFTCSPSSAIPFLSHYLYTNRKGDVVSLWVLQLPCYRLRPPMTKRYTCYLKNDYLFCIKNFLQKSQEEVLRYFDNVPIRTETDEAWLW